MVTAKQSNPLTSNSFLPLLQLPAPYPPRSSLKNGRENHQWLHLCEYNQQMKAHQPTVESSTSLASTVPKDDPKPASESPPPPEQISAHLPNKHAQNEKNY